MFLPSLKNVCAIENLSKIFFHKKVDFNAEVKQLNMSEDQLYDKHKIYICAVYLKNTPLERWVYTMNGSPVFISIMRLSDRLGILIKSLV